MDHRKPALRFDLVAEDDDEVVLVAPPSAGAAAGAGADADDGEEPPVAGIEPGVLTKAYRRVRAYLARQPRRRLVGLTTATAVVVVAGGGTWFTVDHVRDARAERARVAALLESPGGVRDLSAPLRAAWSVPVHGPVQGTLPGLVVVQDGGDVVAYRVSSTPDGAPGGTEAWRVTLGGDLHCGTGVGGRERVPQPQQLVCIAGPAAARRVTVLSAAGKTGAAADLGDTTGLVVWPGPDGGVVTIRRTGQKPERRVFTEMDVTDAYPRGLTEGQGAVITLTDAASGRVRWSATLPFRPVDHPETCGFNQVDNGSGTAGVGTPWYELALDAQVAVGETYVQIVACGVDGAFLPNGIPLDVADGAWVWPHPSGGFVASGNDSGMQVFDEHGALMFTTQGNVDVPYALDRATYPFTFTGYDGVSKSALRDDGTKVWETSTEQQGQAIVTADGVALVMDYTGRAVTALSTATGATLWTATPVNLGSYWVQGAVTDGRTAVLMLGEGQEWGGPAPSSLDEAKGALHVVGLDLATGRSWKVDHDGVDGSFVVVDGNLLEYTGVPTQAGVQLANGETATTTDGRLSLLVPDEDAAEGAHPLFSVSPAAN